MLFQDRVAIVTGAGRGIGREHALLLASEGASVVVNDLGGGTDGSGADTGPAAEVADEIVAAGGVAVANTDDVSDWEGAARLVAQAVDEFGRLDVLINNAGILRDRMLVNLSEDEWDVVMRVNAKGHVAPLRHAAAHWREPRQGRRDGAGLGGQHVVALGAVRQRRPDQLRRGQDGRRRADDDRRQGVGAVRRARQRHRARGPNSAARARAPTATSEADRVRPDGPWPTCRRGSPTSRPTSARSPAAASSCTAGRSCCVEPWRADRDRCTDGRWSLDELVRRGPELADVEIHSNNPFGF